MPRGGARPGAGRPRKLKQPDPPVSKAGAAPSFVDLVDASMRATRIPSAPPVSATLPELPPQKGAKPLPESRNPDMTPLEYCLAVMRNPAAEPERRDRLATALLPYLHQRVADVRPTVKGQKRALAAEKTESGRFAAAPAPRLVVSN